MRGHKDRRSGEPLEVHCAGDVVDVAVSDDDLLDLQPMLLQEAGYLLNLCPRINHHALASSGVADDRAIALQHADRQDLVNDLGLSGGARHRSNTLQKKKTSVRRFLKNYKAQALLRARSRRSRWLL